MALSAAQVANVGKRKQEFITRIVAFEAIDWSFRGVLTGAITWRPFCLLSPRYAFEAIGGTVTISATDSYLRPTTGGGAGNYCVWSKISGAGSIADNGDNTCTVMAGAGITKIKCVVTIAGQTADGYAYVYGGSSGNLDGLVSDVDFSGSLDNGGWEASITLKGDYTSVLTDDGRDQPILLHTQMWWDGVESNFGGYRRHQNTFVLICKNAELYQADGDYYTKLALATPEYILDRMYLGEMKYADSAAGGYYSTASLTPTDVAYHILRERTNYGEEFNISLWNNTSTITNFTVRADSTVWAAIRDCHEYNFGVLWMNRWSNLNGKPAPWARYDEWTAIIGKVYDETNRLPIANLMNYKLTRKRLDDCLGVVLQAVSPSMAIITAGGNAQMGPGYWGKKIKVESLICESQIVLEAWAQEYANFLNNEYELDMLMALGHELEIGSEFCLPVDIPHNLGGDHEMYLGPGHLFDVANWLVKDISYQWDFGVGQWTRQIHAVKLRKWTEDP